MIFFKGFMNLKILQYAAQAFHTTKRITISIDDETFESLKLYARATSKKELVRLNFSKALREILREKLDEKGHYALQTLANTPVNDREIFVLT
jgi:hypothetical protein